MDSSLLATPLVQSIGWALVHFVWQGAAIGIATALALRAFRAAASSTRYAIACGGLVVMLLAPVLTLATAQAPPSPERSNVSVVGSSTGATPQVVVVPGSASSPSISATIPVERVLPLAVVGWMAGVLFMSWRLVAAWLALSRLQAGTRAIDRALSARVADLAGRLGVTRAVRVLESSVVDVPVVVGCLRPVILLPVSAVSGLPVSHLEAVIAHELAHVRRHDYLVNALQAVVETVLFYHPAVWWCSRQIRIEREHCCDDIVVEACGDPVAYARALATLEEQRAGQPALSLAATGGRLIDRIRRLLAPAPTVDRRSAGGVVIVVLALVLSGVTVAPTLFRSTRVIASAAQDVALPRPPRPAPVPAPAAAPAPAPAPAPPSRPVSRVPQARGAAAPVAPVAPEAPLAAPSPAPPGPPLPPLPKAVERFLSSSQSMSGQFEQARANLERAMRELTRAQVEIANQEVQLRHNQEQLKLHEQLVERERMNLRLAEERLAQARVPSEPDAIMAELSKVLETLARRAQTLQADHPDMIRLRRQLDDLKKQIESMKAF